MLKIFADNGDMIKAEKTEKRALSVDEFTLNVTVIMDNINIIYNI